MIKNSDPALYQSYLTARECHRQGNLAGAEAIYSRLLALDPADDELLFLFGNLQASKGALDLGLECLSLAGQLKPANFQVPFSMGLILQGVGRLQDAIEAYRRAVTIAPGFLNAWENLCAACYDHGDYEHGLEAARQALTLDRASVLAIRGAANCCAALGRRVEALTILERGIEEHPALPEMRIHHAWELMANGDFARGWRALEWRNAEPGSTDTVSRLVPWPRWNGEPLMGKTVLVYGEQGIGDEIMYAPFISGILQAGGRCLLECEPRLEHLFAAAFPECQLLLRESVEQIAWRADLPTIDYCISALSLPIYFSPTKDRFLFARPERVAYWRERLEEIGTGLKIGVSWRGGVDAKARKIRSIPAETFGTLVDASTTLVSLQYGATLEEIRSVSNALHHFPEVDAIRDFDEFAALVAALDGVVSVDNSTVHLAGALGIRTLVLLPVYSEWRWGNAVSGASPWYQAVEMMRQREASVAGWQEVLDKARVWLSTVRPVPVAPQSPGSRAAVLHRANGGRSALLVGDRQNWHCWGNSAASLGLHAGLREHFDAVDVVPWGRVLHGHPLAADAAGLDSDELFRHFQNACPDVVAKIQVADCIVIDGGFPVGDPMATLFALYVGYVAVRRFGKRGVLVNAVIPTDNGSAERIHGYQAQACKVLDVVARDASSLDCFGPCSASSRLGFDCLLRGFAVDGSRPSRGQRRKLVLAGIGTAMLRNAVSLVRLISWAHREGHAIDLLIGARGPLDPQEIDAMDGLAKALRGAGVSFELHFLLGEQEWLEAIASASLLVSEDFHHVLAAGFFGVPLLIPEDAIRALSGLLADLGIEKEAVAMTGNPKVSVEMARKLMSDGRREIEPARLQTLRARLDQNFSAL